jgi:hypothetical protein
MLGRGQSRPQKLGVQSAPGNNEYTVQARRWAKLLCMATRSVNVRCNEEEKMIVVSLHEISISTAGSSLNTRGQNFHHRQICRILSSMSLTP